MTEDSSMVITLSHLEVTDTDNPNYPKGFSLKVLPGTKNASYAVSGNTIIPALNFNGFLEVGVTVSDGVNQSGEFKLSILVTPVNDAPEIINLETTPLVYEPGSEPINFTQTVDLIDVDSDHLSMAEIGFRPTNYSAVNDELIINTDSSSIKAIYDPEGILFLVGYAPLEEYKAVIRSLRYHYRMTQDENGNPSEILSGTRTVYLNLHDGQLVSDTHERQITMETKVALDIPNAFTPNGDNSNDTWRIHSVNKEQLDKAVSLGVPELDGGRHAIKRVAGMRLVTPAWRRERARRRQLGLEVPQLGARRQPAVPEQVADLLERGALREIVDVAAAVGEDATIAIQVADRGRGGGDVLETALRLHVAGHEADPI